MFGLTMKNPQVSVPNGRLVHLVVVADIDLFANGYISGRNNTHDVTKPEKFIDIT